VEELYFWGFGWNMNLKKIFFGILTTWDYALTKQCDFQAGKPLKSVFRRLNERLFSSTAWKLSRAFSIPAAALPSLPVATPLAMAADNGNREDFIRTSLNFAHPKK
jgi:hypothetical protein